MICKNLKLIVNIPRGVNYKSVPVTEASGTKRDGNVATVLYRSEPLGEHDTVEVKLTQFTDDIGYEEIFALYEAQKAKRPSAALLEGIGQEAYLAYPTIHVYDRGCLIEITAGSGAGEVQKNILTSLAMRAAGKLEEIIPEYNPDEKN